MLTLPIKLTWAVSLTTMTRIDEEVNLCEILIFGGDMLEAYSIGAGEKQIVNLLQYWGGGSGSLQEYEWLNSHFEVNTSFLSVKFYVILGP